jgi:membrane-bound lytic murein transglycosylase A
MWFEGIHRATRLPALWIAGIAATIAIALLIWRWSVDEPAIRLEPVRFSEIEGWARDDHAAAFATLLKTCRKRRDGNPACKEALALGEKADRKAARAFFEAHFIPHRVDEPEPGLVTGYYEPEVNGSRERTEKFSVPVYRRPDDLVQLKPDELRAFYNASFSVGRQSGKDLVPYYSRAEIESGALEGQGLELLYLDDPVELFFMQIQGSGRVRFPDGSWVRLGYAAKNGHSYTSIGKLLFKRGEKPAGGLTMEGLKSWLREDPERGRALMQENASYVFFRELPPAEAGDGPVGAQAVALTPGRSLAVDPIYHKLGTPVFVSAPDLKTPKGKPFRRLMIAQDVGSAIRGTQRGDIYWGSGAEAGAIAGVTKHPARFYVLLPKR